MSESRADQLRRMREESISTPPTPAVASDDALALVAAATARKQQAVAAWEQAICQAHAGGRSLRSIASVAGVSNPTVLAIVRAHSA